MDTSSDTKEIHQNGDISNEMNGHVKSEKTSPLMCKFTLVNSYGTAEVALTLKRDGQPLKLSSRTYLAVDWNPLAQDKYYDDKAAEVIHILTVYQICILAFGFFGSTEQSL